MGASNDGRARLGPVGAVLGSDDWNAVLAEAPAVEELGYTTIWLSGGPSLGDLDRIPGLAAVTSRVPLSTAVIAADQFGADAVGELYRGMEAAHPGRFLPGLGGAHGPRPLRTLGGYLDRLDDGPAPIPAGSRLLSALGPRMLDLAAQRAAGAVPVLVSPEYTAWARARLGDDTLLVVEQFVALDTDAARARDTARGILAFLRDNEGGYPRHFRRWGFTDEDITTLSDRLVDALAACGDLDGVVKRVTEHHAAGADQVALRLLSPGGAPATGEQWRLLAQALLP